MRDPVRELAVDEAAQVAASSLLGGMAVCTPANRRHMSWVYRLCRSMRPQGQKGLSQVYACVCSAVEQAMMDRRLQVHRPVGHQAVLRPPGFGWPTVNVVHQCHLGPPAGEGSSACGPNEAHKMKNSLQQVVRGDSGGGGSSSRSCGTGTRSLDGTGTRLSLDVLRHIVARSAAPSAAAPLRVAPSPRPRPHAFVGGRTPTPT